MKKDFINWLKENRQYPRARRLLSFIRRNEIEGLEGKRGYESIYYALDMGGADRKIINDFEHMHEEYVTS